VPGLLWAEATAPVNQAGQTGLHQVSSNAHASSAEQPRCC
jgi:hypothetical protein